MKKPLLPTLAAALLGLSLSAATFPGDAAKGEKKDCPACCKDGKACKDAKAKESKDAKAQAPKA